MRYRSLADALARAALVAALMWGRPAAAQYGVGGRLLADGELWSTDAGSRLLTRDLGHLAPLFRLQLLADVMFGKRLHLLALGEMEGGKATNTDKIEGNVYQLVLRYVPTRAAVFEGGRLVHPVGVFAQRRFSNVNPLIGTPDGYPVTYPWGAQVSGIVKRFDYRLALVTLPASHQGYVPEAGARLRPAVGIGFSPAPWIRLGVSGTVGPYLNRDLQDSLPAGSDWKDFQERVLAFDARFAIGYFESHTELALTGYDAPTASEPVNGVTVYVEGKYTWTPRFFTALRLEYNNYAFIRPAGGGTWFAQTTRMSNGEVGVGYRLNTSLLLKASYRRDRWPPDLSAFLPNGHAAAIQISYQVDLQP